MPDTAGMPRPADSPDAVVVGLGNPGAEYAHSRHNVGFMAVDVLAGAAARYEHSGPALVTRAGIEGRKVLLVKPLTYMNRSGVAVQRLLESHGIGPERLVVVLDDFNLPFGRLRVRPRGSAGGHRGLESIIAETGTVDFARVRVGIGEESMPDDRSDFVLEEWPRERRSEVEEVIGRAAEAVRTILRDGTESAMARFNA